MPEDIDNVVNDVQTDANVSQEMDVVDSVEAVTTESHDEGVQAEQKEEKMVPQSRVNKLIAAEKRKAEQRAYQVLQERLQASGQLNQQTQQKQPDVPLNMSEMTQAQLDEYIDNRANRLADEKANKQYLERFAREFDTKINTALEDDPEFEEALNNLELPKFPNLALLVNEFDNTADILKELAKYPSKFQSVIGLANSGARKLALIELKNLSDSIKRNKESLKKPKAPEPLSQAKPSNVTTGGSKKSDPASRLADLKQRYRA